MVSFLQAIVSVLGSSGFAWEECPPFSPLVPAHCLHRPAKLPFQLWTLYLSWEIHLLIRAAGLSSCVLRHLPLLGPAGPLSGNQLLQPCSPGTGCGGEA